MRWQTAEKHCVQRYSQKAFQSYKSPSFTMDLYCSNTNWTMVLWQKCGVFILNVLH